MDTPVATLTVEEALDESGDYAACIYCGRVWSNEMLRDDKRVPSHGFPVCHGSGHLPVAPTLAQIRTWHAEQQKEKTT